jgi:hypothetical protein
MLGARRSQGNSAAELQEAITKLKRCAEQLNVRSNYATLLLTLLHHYVSGEAQLAANALHANGSSACLDKNPLLLWVRALV